MGTRNAEERRKAAGKHRKESFSVQQFFKNAAEVWASSPHLRSKSKLHRETKQKSKRKSEESQLPLKSKGCNEIQGFRGNCDSQASWGCAPALPNQFRVVFLGAIQSVSHETLHQNRMTASNEPQANKFVSQSTILSTSFEKMVETNKINNYI